MNRRSMENEWFLLTEYEIVQFNKTNVLWVLLEWCILANSNSTWSSSLKKEEMRRLISNDSYCICRAKHTDNWMESVFVCSVSDPIGLSIWTNPWISATLNDSLLFTNRLQFSIFAEDLTVVQFIAIKIPKHTHTQIWISSEFRAGLLLILSQYHIHFSLLFQFS